MKPLLINITLIDDHKLLTESLSVLLAGYDFINNIKIYNRAKEYLAMADDPETDIIISDILMPEMDGMSFIKELRRRNKKTKIIILSSITEMQTVRYAIRSMANGYLAKDGSVDELADAILTVYHGKPFIGESLKDQFINNTFIEEQFIYNLSPREKDVLNLVCAGKTIKECAYEMQLSVNTVQTYYKSILKKFKLHRTADLIVFAIKSGLYQPPK